MQKYDDFSLTESIVKECEQRNIELCRGLDDWFTLAFVLSKLGERGRDLFHRLSCLSDNYRSDSTDAQFDYALRNPKNKYTIGTLIWKARQAGIDTKSLLQLCPKARASEKPTFSLQAKQRQQVDYLPLTLIERPVIRYSSNLLAHYLCSYFTIEQVVKACKRYRVFNLSTQETCFPQIDYQGRLRTGKIIPYGIDGHRLKDRGTDWVHSRLEKNGKLKSGFHLQQCLFGEHLLPKYPDLPVSIVESEKTALICSMVFPDWLWLAVGSKNNLKPDLCDVLKGRKVMLWPDADGMEDWRKRCKDFCYWCNCDVVEWAGREPQGSKRDVADLIIEAKDRQALDSESLFIIRQALSRESNRE